MVLAVLRYTKKANNLSTRSTAYRFARTIASVKTTTKQDNRTSFGTVETKQTAISERVSRDGKIHTS
jgi:hypothetical protein